MKLAWSWTKGGMKIKNKIKKSLNKKQKIFRNTLSPTIQKSTVLLLSEKQP